MSTEISIFLNSQIILKDVKCGRTEAECIGG